MRWLVSQADGIFSQREVLNTKFAVKYLSPPIPIEISTQVAPALHRDLTRNLGGTQKTVFDFLRLSLDAIIERDDPSWHELNLVAILQPAITSTTNRILVGKDLCGNETFLVAFGKSSNYLGIGAVVIGQYICLISWTRLLDTWPRSPSAFNGGKHLNTSSPKSKHAWMLSSSRKATRPLTISRRWMSFSGQLGLVRVRLLGMFWMPFSLWSVRSPCLGLVCHPWILHIYIFFILI